VAVARPVAYLAVVGSGHRADYREGDQRYFALHVNFTEQRVLDPRLLLLPHPKNSRNVERPPGQ
jgi:hypothetical protein